MLIDHIVSKAHEASYYKSTTRIKTELPLVYSNVLTTYSVDQTAEPILKVEIQKVQINKNHYHKHSWVQH